MPDEIIAQPQAEVTEVKETIPEPVKIKVKYNHEEKELLLDEAIPLVQKGMNYDKLTEQLEALKNDEALKIADKLAKKYGVTRTELLKKWDADLEADAIKEYAEENDVSPAVAKDIVETKRQKEQLEIAKKDLEWEMERDRQIAEFRAEYPDVKDEDVPDEVITLCNRGVPLVTAYAAWDSKNSKARLKALEEQLGVKKANETNAASSMGPVAGSATAPFKITEDWLKKASLKEYEDHRDEVKEWYFNKRK